MASFVVRNDFVVVEGTVTSAWKDAWVPDQLEWNWHLVVQLTAGDQLLVTASGAINFVDAIECVVTPVAPYRDEPWAGELLSVLYGKAVRLGGTWGDQTDDAGNARTIIRPIGWIVAEELSIIVEEHGFNQAVRDVNLFAFSDHSAVTPETPTPPHHQQDRHFDISLAFPRRPQSEAVAVCAECLDRDDAEHLIYFGRLTSRPRFPIKQVRTYVATKSNVVGADLLTVSIDTGTAATGQGFAFVKLALTYDEPFHEMCLPNVCLTEPDKSCQATGELRHSWRWPRLDSAQAGDLLLGPAGSGGLIGDLLAALHGPQFYDHMVLFAEDDGQTVRHCTSSDSRVADPAYYTATVKVETPFGDIEERLPLKGIRNDILKYGWPGSITQTLGEVSITGRNRANPEFSYETFYPKVTDRTPLWQLDASERHKRTSFHDPEATAKALAGPNPDSGLRKYYEQVRFQRDPAWRSEIDPGTRQPKGWIWPTLVKPHPKRDAAVRSALKVIAAEAKKIRAHYRFFAYSDSTIAKDARSNAPAESGWAAGSVAAQCSSFVWAAVQAANITLANSGKPTIELEGEAEASDHRPPARADGIYLYTHDERLSAAKALWDNAFKKVTREIQAKVDDLPGIVTALVDVTGISSGIDGIKNMLGTIVANQLCNIFAFDTPEDVMATWANPGEGVAVSPDDTMLNWDVAAAVNAFPPSASPGKINVYGTATPINVSKGGWVSEPILKIKEFIGFGSVSGIVTRREARDARVGRVAGATVRFGCGVVATDPEGSYAFNNVKAGAYFLHGAMFIVDKASGIAVEWKSEPRLVKLADGDNFSGIELELLPPPGLARDVKIMSHFSIVDRVVVGKDRWGHFDIPFTINLLWDPRDDATAPADQRNTTLSDKALRITPAVGSGVHVSVDIKAALRNTGNPVEPFDGAVIVDTTLKFFDTGEGEVNAVITDLGRVLGSGDTFELPINLVSDDTVPERASGYVRISNIWAALP